MPEYRAYLIGPDGHIVKRVELVCTDEVAREQAKTLAEWPTAGSRGGRGFTAPCAFTWELNAGRRHIRIGVQTLRLGSVSTRLSHAASPYGMGPAPVVHSQTGNRGCARGFQWRLLRRV
jgi:hypothetical protein